MTHHQDSNWGLVMDGEEGRGSKAVAGHADMTCRALAALATGRNRAGLGQGVLNQGCMGWSDGAVWLLTSCF